MAKTHTSSQIQVTPEGLKSLQNEFCLLKNVQRPKLVERMANAREKGDLSENSDYSNSKEELATLDGRITELEKLLSRAVVTAGDQNDGLVQLGRQVTLKIVDKNIEQVFQIVSPWETDPLRKKISCESPLGKALIGNKVGKIVEIQTPSGKIKYKIVKIER